MLHFGRYIMQKENPEGYATLQENFADIARSNVDPADLACDLFSAKIISKGRVEEATYGGLTI